MLSFLKYYLHFIFFITLIISNLIIDEDIFGLLTERVSRPSPPRGSRRRRGGDSGSSNDIKAAPPSVWRGTGVSARDFTLSKLLTQFHFILLILNFSKVSELPRLQKLDVWTN